MYIDSYIIKLPGMFVYCKVSFFQEPLKLEAVPTEALKPAPQPHTPVETFPNLNKGLVPVRIFQFVAWCFWLFMFLLIFTTWFPFSIPILSVIIWWYSYSLSGCFCCFDFNIFHNMENISHIVHILRTLSKKALNSIPCSISVPCSISARSQLALPQQIFWRFSYRFPEVSILGVGGHDPQILGVGSWNIIISYLEK